MSAAGAKRPPRDITPEGFFTEWLPREFAAEFGAGKRHASDITVAIQLDGEGGGRWILDGRGGTLHVRRPDEPGAEPQVSLQQTVADWRAMAMGESGAQELAPPEYSPLDVLFVDPSSRQIMASVKGTLRFEVTNYNGRTWWMQVKFGTQPTMSPPTATISVDSATYALMLERKLAPPEAYFSGKIVLKGNTALAMQLGMAMLPRFVGKS